MAKRIGEVLVEKGLITRQQLFAGLKAQLMLGGHLGTSLIELGYITEERLGRELSEILGVPFAPREMFDNIPEWAINCLDPGMVEKHRAIPIGKQANSLHLAVISPRDIAPLSSLSGYKIVPWVSPETRIVEAMERYYGIPRTTRYICISKDLRRGRVDPAIGTAAGPEIYPGDWMALSAQQQAHMARASSDSSSCVGEHAIELNPAAPDPTSGAADQADDFIAGSWREIAKRYFEDDGDSAQKPARPASRRAALDSQGDGSKWTFSEAAMLLSHADDEEELNRVAMAYASGQLSAAILFRVTADVATAQACHGPGLSEDRFEGLEFGVAENSLFDLLLGEDFYCGPVPRRNCYQRFFEALQREAPQEIVLVPIYLSDHLVGILYGEGLDNEPLTESLPDLRQLARKLSLAMHMLVLKARIRAM